jgi:LysR family tcuABC transcriptional regulator
VELRQLRYFVRVAELGSLGKAASDLGLVTSALSQQISRLEGELSTRLLQRTASGAVPTEAGLALLRQARLVLRHADEAVRAAQHARLSGQVSVGLAPTTAAVIGLPLIQAMRERYPEVRLHLVESLSGHLASMLENRQIDLAVLFKAARGGRWHAQPLLTERLFLIATPPVAPPGTRRRIKLERLAEVPLILPSGPHGLRATIDAAFAAAKVQPLIVAEIDSLALLMDAVRAGLGATLQPGAAVARLPPGELLLSEISGKSARRDNLIVSLAEDELTPAALAARLVLRDVASAQVASGRWPGAFLVGAGLHEG